MNTSAPISSPGSGGMAGLFRLLLFLAPAGSLALGIAAANLLAPATGPWIHHWLPLPLLCLVTIAAGASESLLKHKGEGIPGTPRPASVAIDTLVFGLAQILLIPCLGFIYMLIH